MSRIRQQIQIRYTGGIASWLFPLIYAGVSKPSNYHPVNLDTYLAGSHHVMDVAT